MVQSFMNWRQEQLVLQLKGRKGHAAVDANITERGPWKTRYPKDVVGHLHTINT